MNVIRKIRITSFAKPNTSDLDQLESSCTLADPPMCPVDPVPATSNAYVSTINIKFTDSDSIYGSGIEVRKTNDTPTMMRAIYKSIQDQEF